MCALDHVPVHAAEFEYRIEKGTILLSDATELAVSHYVPITAASDAKFPVILELLPYRKDDLSLGWSHSYNDFFARKGFALARVDVRGTGSSGGLVPEREYSDTEIEDAIEVIAALSELPWSNGKVAMWGISWGGFNAVQVALRNPPHLEAILAAHTSDDLFKNDVHYIDGIFGVDEYMLSINHMTGFMRSPDYNIDEEYFSNRFDREPWMFTYLRHARDGDFWRPGSLHGQYDKIKIPIYFIGGLLDGYRDTLPRALEGLSTPVRAVLGPWNHSWPHGAAPGPGWEWREDAAQWLGYWLGKADATLADSSEQSFRFFLRDSETPSLSTDRLAGQWYATGWPLPARETQNRVFYPASENLLVTEIATQNVSTETLTVVPSSGVDLGDWWGELTPDMRSVDAHSLTYDSGPLEEELAMVGFAEVSLLAAADSSQANWVARLEDVHPDGQVSLVAGAAINGSQRNSTMQPAALNPGEFVPLNFKLHFTTWKFKPGHRVRLAISNSAFPMFWPSPNLSSSSLRVNAAATSLSLPIWTGITNHQAIDMPPPGASASLAAETISFDAVEARPTRFEIVENKLDNTVSVVRESGLVYQIGNTQADNASIQIVSERESTYKTSDVDPAQSSYRAMAQYSLSSHPTLEGEVRYRTNFELHSDATHFHLNIERTLENSAGVIRRKQWEESILRDHQ